MLIQVYRPRRFADVHGADHPKLILQRIIRDPDRAPRSLIFKGGRGLGKTTCVRIFVRALNCEVGNGDACNQCASCLSITDNSPLYSEFDSAMVGNVEEMKIIRELFSYQMTKGKRVIGLDESQLCSRAAQSSLLKVLEEAPKGIFFVFLTTDPDRILTTILSRSLEIEFSPLTETETTNLLREVARKEQIELDAETLHHIFRRVRGHARDALQQLEMVKLIGAEDYRAHVKILDDQFELLITAFKDQKRDVAGEIINAIVTQPVVNITQDFDIFIRRKADELFLEQTIKDERIDHLIMFYLRNHQYVRSTNDWYLFLSHIATLFPEKVKDTVNEVTGRYLREVAPRNRMPANMPPITA